MKNVNTLLIEAVELLSEATRYDKEMFNKGEKNSKYWGDKAAKEEAIGKKLAKDASDMHDKADKEKWYKVKTKKDLHDKADEMNDRAGEHHGNAFTARYNGKLASKKSQNESDEKNKTLTESIDKLMSIVETVEFNMIYESLTEATTEEDEDKKENKLKVAKDTIVKAVKKIIEIIEQKIQDLYNIVMTKFKSDHLVVSEDTVVYNMNFSTLSNDIYNGIYNDDETKYLYAIKYAEGKKIAKSKILDHIKKYKIYISDCKEILNKSKKDLTEANVIKLCIRVITKSIDSYYKLLRNTKADEVKETKE